MQSLLRNPSAAVLAGLGAIAIAACSAGGGDDSQVTGGNGGSSQGGSAQGGSSQGGSSQGGSGNNGFGGAIDAGGGNAGSAGFNSDAACESVDQTADNKLQPADIIFAVDNSGSMDQEAAFVQSAIGLFANGIGSVGIDYHVILISAGSNGSNGICAPAPLGSGQCPSDSKPPNYLRVDREVGSSNALAILIDEFDNYKSMLREGASKHVVVISDDNSSMSAPDFSSAYSALLAGVDPLFTKYTFHGVYGFTEPNPFTCLGNPGADKCCGPGGIPLTASVGTVYKQLAEMTGGEKGNLCEQEQGFVAVFTKVGQSVIVGSKLACEWNIPPAPSGQTFNKDQVNVEYVPPGGGSESFGRVDSPAACSGVVDGWYYDNPSNPTKIFVCPQTCTRIQAAGDNAEIQIQFGCASEPAIPK